MIRMDASKHDPEEDGVYVCWLLGARYPVVLCWSGGPWRRGALKVQVTSWLGPLPEQDNRNRK